MHAVLQSASPSIASAGITCSDPEQRTSSGPGAQSAGVGAESTVVDIVGNAVPGGVVVPSSEHPQFSTDEAVCGQGKEGLNSPVAMEGDPCGDSATVEIPEQSVDRNDAGVGERAAEAATEALGEAKSEIVVDSAGVTAGPDEAGMGDCGAENKGATVVDMWSSLVEVLEVST